jgi:hypothetical protein
MARHTFFSFHHARDVWRAAQVRNSWVLNESAGFWDKADWEAVKRKDKATIHRWIDEQMRGTSVTVVLIGAETASREHVGYEILQSHNKGNGLLGIYVHNIKDSNQRTDFKGRNPFLNWQFESGDRTILFSDFYPTYDWVNDGGRNNLGTWIEAAAKRAGR